MDNEELQASITEALHRLGAESVQPDAPDQLEIAGAQVSLAHAFKQLLYGFKFPGPFFADVLESRTTVKLRVSSRELDEYECVLHKPYVVVGKYGFENKLLIDLSDPRPSNPALYYLDHDDYDDAEPGALGTLSDWLQSASRDQ